MSTFPKFKQGDYVTVGKDKREYKVVKVLISSVGFMYELKEKPGAYHESELSHVVS
jgi:hypothetical protein